MALAAVHFCHELQKPATDKIIVHLVEGFASRYTADPNRKPGHQDVARELLRLWFDEPRLASFDANIKLVSIPQILGHAEDAPVVLCVRDGLAI